MPQKGVCTAVGLSSYRRHRQASGVPTHTDFADSCGRARVHLSSRLPPTGLSQGRPHLVQVCRGHESSNQHEISSREQAHCTRHNGQCDGRWRDFARLRSVRDIRRCADKNRSARWLLVRIWRVPFRWYHSSSADGFQPISSMGRRRPLG